MLLSCATLSTSLFNPASKVFILFLQVTIPFVWNVIPLPPPPALAFQTCGSLSFKSLKFFRRPTSACLFPFEHSTQCESQVYACSCAFGLCPITRKTSPDLEGHFSAKRVCLPRTAKVSLHQGPRGGRGRQARCSLGIVVKAAQRRRGREIARSVRETVTRCERQEAKASTYLDLGPHAGAPDTRGGEQRGGKCQPPQEKP